MERYTEIKKIQYSCTATLYFIVRSAITSAMNLKMKRKILSTLLNVMYAHRQDTVVMRNSCLILCQFELPNDVVSKERKVEMYRVRHIFWPGIKWQFCQSVQMIFKKIFLESKGLGLVNVHV